jgi:hypothetical protein
MENNWSNYWFKFIIQLSKKPLIWYLISKNPNLTMEIIEKYPDKPWEWNLISCNLNLTMDMIEKYPDKHWNSQFICYNKFTKDKEQFEARVAHQKFVQDNLFEELVKVYMSPKRVLMLLELGYSAEELDDIM